MSKRTSFALIALSLLAVIGVAYGQQAVPNAGAIPSHFVSVGSTNSTLVKGSIGNVYNIVITSTATANSFFKLYDSATAPACGTPVPVQTYSLPVSGGSLSIDFPVGMQFYKGIAFCLTGAAADNDTSVGLVGIIMNIVYK